MLALPNKFYMSKLLIVIDPPFIGQNHLIYKQISEQILFDINSLISIEIKILYILFNNFKNVLLNKEKLLIL